MLVNWHKKPTTLFWMLFLVYCVLMLRLINLAPFGSPHGVLF